MNKTEYLLTCLIEEAAEVQQAATKCLRFGMADQWPAENSPLNKEKLIYELLDLITVIEMIDLKEDIYRPFSDISRQHIRIKKQKIITFMAYSQQRGTLTE